MATATAASPHRMMLLRKVKCPLCQDERSYKPSEPDSALQDDHHFSHTARVFFGTQQCSICLEDGDSPMVVLPCGHVVCRTDFSKLGGMAGKFSRLPEADAAALQNLPLIIQHLDQEGASGLQFEALVALNSLSRATGFCRKIVVESGLVRVLVHLVNVTDDDSVRHIAVAVLMHIAQASTEYRDLVLHSGVVWPLLRELQEQDTQSAALLCSIVGFVRVLCQGHPPPQFKMVGLFLPFLARLLHHEDSHVIKEACSAVSEICRITNGNPERKQAFVHAGVCCPCASLLNNPSVDVQRAAAQTLAGVSVGNLLQRMVVANSGALPHLQNLLSSHEDDRVREYACATIANVMGHTRALLTANVERDVLCLMARVVALDRCMATRKGASLAINNAGFGGKVQSIKILTNHGCIGPLCDMLTASSPLYRGDLIRNTLVGLRNLLRVAETEGSPAWARGVAVRISDAGGRDSIMGLRSDPDDAVSSLSKEIVDAYFRDDAECKSNGRRKRRRVADSGSDVV